MSELTVERVVFAPVRGAARILALPVGWLAQLITLVRSRSYNPEKIVCPACGFRGDSGTDGKTCRVRFIRTMAPKKGMLQHICFRCGCDEIYTQIRSTSDAWLNSTIPEIQQRIAVEAARRVL